MKTQCAIAAAGLLVSLSTSVWGATLGLAPACQNGTFATYISGPATLPSASVAAAAVAPYTCNIGDVDVTNFELYTLSSEGFATPADLTLLNTITISPFWDAEAKRASLNFQGFTDLTVAANETSGYRIRYTIDPPPVIGSDSFELDPPFGEISGSLRYCADTTFSFSDGTFCTGRGGVVSFGFNDLNSPANTPGSFILDPPTAVLDTITDIVLNPNGGRPSGFDGIVYSIQVVPEPGTWLLAAAGLALVGRLRRIR